MHLVFKACFEFCILLFFSFQYIICLDFSALVKRNIFASAHDTYKYFTTQTTVMNRTTRSSLKLNLNVAFCCIINLLI